MTAIRRLSAALCLVLLAGCSATDTRADDSARTDLHSSLEVGYSLVDALRTDNEQDLASLMAPGTGWTPDAAMRKTLHQRVSAATDRDGSDGVLVKWAYVTRNNDLRVWDSTTGDFVMTICFTSTEKAADKPAVWKIDWSRTARNSQSGPKLVVPHR